MIKTVIFDLDDTLYDEIDYCKSGFKSIAGLVAEKFNLHDKDSIFDALWKQFSSGNRTKTFNTALDVLGISYNDELINELVGFYRNHHPDIKLPEESRKILKQLAGKYSLALITDGFMPAQRLKVGALGIEKYFKCIFYTEELGRQFWKPSKVGFEKIIEALDAEPETTAFVGDNAKKDFIAPNQLGFLTVQLIRPARLHTDTADQYEAKPEYVINKIEQLPDLLDNASEM